LAIRPSTWSWFPWATVVNHLQDAAKQVTRHSNPCHLENGVAGMGDYNIALNPHLQFPGKAIFYDATLY